jgi:hypothetical protein
VLGEVYRTISRHLIGKAGLSRATGATGATGAVTLVQRFGSALNLNVHFHMVFLDGAYQTVGAAAPLFHPVPPPESSDLQQLVEHIAGRIGRALEHRGLVERDLENAWLSADKEAGPLDDLLGHSITYRIAMGPRAGQKLFTLQTVAPRLHRQEGEPNGAARAGGFSLYAGVGIAPNERAKLERLCRYVSRPPVASERLALTASGQVRYTLKTPYRDGTTHIVLEPLDIMARLAALVPTPRMHLRRYHGVFAPHSQHRAAVTRGDELGTTAQASVRRGDRELHALRRGAEDHRQHRGGAAHCEDPVAPGARGTGAVPERVAAGGVGAARAVQPAVNWRMTSRFH